MKTTTGIRIGGWILSAGLLYVLWLVAASISDNANLDGTGIQKAACGFLIVSCWPAVFIEKLLGNTFAFLVTILIEGGLCWEIGHLVHRMIRRKNK